MAKVILTIIGYILLYILELTDLKFEKNTKKIIVFSFFYLIAFTLSLLISLNIKIPSPAIAIKNYFFK
jgi:hypothetical protein